jgi:hypothetical protein
MRYINSGVAGGGVLKVRAPVQGKWIFSAEITWPGEDTIRGPISTTVQGALENLNAFIQDAQEQENTANR